MPGLGRLSRSVLLLSLTLCVADLFAALPAGAIRHPMGWFEEYDDRWFFGGDEDFLVVTIVSVRDSGATNANPPDVTVRVEEVLRGRYEPGVQPIGWPAVPLFLPCAVGEGATIRRWQNTPLPGPPIGSRMILGGHMTAEGRWVCDGMMRWKDDGSFEAAEVRRKIREWGPSAAARQKREAKAREEKARHDRAKQARLESERRDRERRWLHDERDLREGTDVASLVRQSDAIFLAAPPRPREPGGAWTRTMLTFDWFLGTPPAGSDSTVVTFGREAARDSVVRRWILAPVDDAPGVESGDSLRGLVFARVSREPRPENSASFFRPVDSVRGMLLADSALVRRVREEVARRGLAPTEPPVACGANFLEFVGVDSSEVAGVALKFTALRKKRQDPVGSVVLASGPAGFDRGFTSLHAGTFPPCAGARRLAADDHEGGLQLQVAPRSMRALLDSLATLPRLASGTIDPHDAVLLSLHGILEGRQRAFDATLDSVSIAGVNRFLAALFPEEGVARWNLPRFWQEVDPELLAIWQRATPRRVPPPPLPSPNIPEGQGQVLGVVVDETTREPLRGFFVRTTRPWRIAETGSDGFFALTRLPAGSRGMLVYGPGHDPSYAEVRVESGRLQPLVLRVLREGRWRPSILAPRTRVAPPFELPRLQSRLHVEVFDVAGDPVGGAHVRLEYGDVLAGGFTGEDGHRDFRDLPQGPVRLTVRAPGYEPFEATVEVVDYDSQTFEVVLPAGRTISLSSD